MPRTKKTGTCRQVGFRMPLTHFDVVERTAVALGVDLTAVLNLLISEAIPFLAEKVEQHNRDVARLDEALKRKESA
jgi:hypothetical protein